MLREGQKTRDGRRRRCIAPAGRRPCHRSGQSRAREEKRETTFHGRQGCSRWGWRWRSGRGRWCGKFQRWCGEREGSVDGLSTGNIRRRRAASGTATGVGNTIGTVDGSFFRDEKNPKQPENNQNSTQTSVFLVTTGPF